VFVGCAYGQETTKQATPKEAKVNWELKYYQEKKAHLETVKKNHKLSNSNADAIIENNNFRIQFVINPEIKKVNEKIKELKELDSEKVKE